ncbi:MAG: hypothetical protein KC483_10215 [Nitrosarchaeum sp.]|nr:hypothetical protein [Nitrosarchaeum sp.]
MSKEKEEKKVGLQHSTNVEFSAVAKSAAVKCQDCGDRIKVFDSKGGVKFLRPDAFNEQYDRVK